MNDEDRNLLNQVQTYRKLVLLYEALGSQIHNLLMANDGLMDHMSVEDRERYRELAHKRDDVFNEMMALGQELSVDSDLE